MWSAYKYIYYWLYTWNRNLWGESDVPEFNAVLGMSLSLMCNLFSFLIMVHLISGLELPEGKGKIILPLLAIIIGVHYFAFMHKDKYEEIEKEFKNESRGERRKKGFFVLLYTFGSVFFYIFLLFWGIWLKQ